MQKRKIKSISFQTISKEPFEDICLFLNFMDVIKLSYVSKHFHSNANEKSLWRNLLYQFFEKDILDGLKFLYEKEYKEEEFKKIFSSVFSISNECFRNYIHIIYHFREPKYAMLLDSPFFRICRNLPIEKNYRDVMKLFQRAISRVNFRVLIQKTGEAIYDEGEFVDMFNEKDSSQIFMKISLLPYIKKSYTIVRGNRRWVGGDALDYPQREHYVGDFKKDDYHGRGKMTNSANTSYNGEFEGGNIKNNSEILITSPSLKLEFKGKFLNWEKNNFQGEIFELGKKKVLQKGEWINGENKDYPGVYYHFCYYCDHCKQSPITSCERYQVGSLDFCKKCYTQLKKDGKKSVDNFLLSNVTIFKCGSNLS